MKARAIPVLFAVFLSICFGCSDEKSTNDPTPTDPTWAGITYDVDARTMTFEATLQRSVAEAGSWHLIVYDGGSNNEAAFFVTSVVPQSIFEALEVLGGTPGNNVTSDNYGEPDIATAGDVVETTITWAGAPKSYELDELLVEDATLPGGGPFGLEIRFAGNYEGVAGTNPSDQTGCISCLYSCPAGIMSNAKANLALLESDGNQFRYTANPDLLPEDGTVVTFTLTIAR